MYNKTFSKKEVGQSLVELVVVVAAMVIVVGALTFATIASLRNAQFSKNQAQATKLAQEGIERVRTGRDRNQLINHNGFLGSVISWNGSSSGAGRFWDYLINGNCGNVGADPKVYCFFNVNSLGVLSYITAYGQNPNNPNQPILPQGAESIPPFNRAVIISDDALTRDSQKTVTAVVTWTDFSGNHKSELTTILRRK